MRLILILAASLIVTNLAAADDGQVTKMARDAKFQSCLSTVAELDKFFGEGVNYGNWSVWSKESVDKQLFNTSMELSFSDGTHLIDFTVAPTADGSCSYSYTRTWYSPKSCLATSKEAFLKDAEYKTELNKIIALFTKGPSKILLMPADTGCIVQKKEVGFAVDKQGSK